MCLGANHMREYPSQYAINLHHLESAKAHILFRRRAHSSPKHDNRGIYSHQGQIRENKIQAWHTDDNLKRNIMHPRMHETLHQIRTNSAVTEWNLLLSSDELKTSPSGILLFILISTRVHHLPHTATNSYVHSSLSPITS